MTKNLSESTEITMTHLTFYADCLRPVEPRTESSIVQILLAAGGNQTMKFNGRYVKFQRTISRDAHRGWNQHLGQDLYKDCQRPIGHDAVIK